MKKLKSLLISLLVNLYSTTSNGVSMMMELITHVAFKYQAINALVKSLVSTTILVQVASIQYLSIVYLMFKSIKKSSFVLTKKTYA